MGDLGIGHIHIPGAGICLRRKIEGQLQGRSVSLILSILRSVTLVHLTATRLTPSLTSSALSFSING
jgi:hypothetical protein